MKKISIFSSRKAMRNHNKILLGLQEIESRMIKPQQEIQQGEPQMTLDDYNRQNGVPSSFSVKRNMAKSLGINDYIGSKEHDNQILMGMQGVNQAHTTNQGMENENKYKDKDYALKERELGLKEQEIKQKTAQLPTAEDIADAIINKSNNK